MKENMNIYRQEEGSWTGKGTDIKTGRENLEREQIQQFKQG